MAQLTQQIKILHIARTHLNNVDFGKQIEAICIHDFCDDWQSGFMFGL